MHEDFLVWLSSFCLPKICIPQSQIVFHVTEEWGWRVYVCVRTCVLQSTQKMHCWPDQKQHSRLFPTDKEGLLSHSETGPIYCLWLQKTGNRSHSRRECSSLSRQQKCYWHYSTVQSQRKEIEEKAQSRNTGTQ